MKRICLLALIFSAAVFAGEAPPAPAPSSGEPAILDPAINKGILPAHYGALPLLWIPKLKDPAKFDGTLGDPVWNGAAQIELRDTVSGKTPKLATRGYLFCTDAALYFGLRCAETRLDELQVKEAEIGKRDSIEIFIEPYKDTLQKPYHHIMLDAAGAIKTARYHVYQRLRHPQHLEGGLWQPNLDVKTAKGSGEWTLELRVPFDQLVMSDAAKKKQTLWRMNIFRTRPAKPAIKAQKKRSESHASWAWSPPGAKLYHSAGKFGYVLPESMATPELIQEVCKTAYPPPIAEKPLDEAEVAKRLAELGSGDFDTRLAASQRLELIIANAGPVALESIQKKLEALLKSAKAAETWAMAKDTLDDLKSVAERLNDDDPPPAGFE